MFSCIITFYLEDGTNKLFQQKQIIPVMNIGYSAQIFRLCYCINLINEIYFRQDIYQEMYIKFIELILE